MNAGRHLSSPLLPRALWSCVPPPSSLMLEFPRVCPQLSCHLPPVRLECSSLALGRLQPRPFSGTPDLSSLSLEATAKALSSLQSVALQLVTGSHNQHRGCSKPRLRGQGRLLGGGRAGAERELARLGGWRAYCRSGEHRVQRHLGT